MERENGKKWYRLKIIGNPLDYIRQLLASTKGATSSFRTQENFIHQRVQIQPGSTTPPFNTIKEQKNHNAQQTPPSYLHQDDVYLLTGLLIKATIECVLPFFFSGGFLWTATKNMLDAFFCNKIIEKAISIGDSIKMTEISDSIKQINSLLRTVILLSLNIELAQDERYNQGENQLQIKNKINHFASYDLTLFKFCNKKESYVCTHAHTIITRGHSKRHY